MRQGFRPTARKVAAWGGGPGDEVTYLRGHLAAAPSFRIHYDQTLQVGPHLFRLDIRAVVWSTHHPTTPGFDATRVLANGCGVVAGTVNEARGRFVGKRILQAVIPVFQVFLDRQYRVRALLPDQLGDGLLSTHPWGPRANVTIQPSASRICRKGGRAVISWGRSAAACWARTKWCACIQALTKGRGDCP